MDNKLSHKANGTSGREGERWRGGVSKQHKEQTKQLELGLVVLLMLSLGLIINFDAFVIINTVDPQR